MKIKTIEQYLDEKNRDFDIIVNNFIKNKQVVQITTDVVVSIDNVYSHILTVLYKEDEK